MQKNSIMAKIYSLKISNYRGIQSFEQVFGQSNFICLIGRGDSGKTTILNAIYCALNPNWNLSFYDTDFYNGDIESPIIIEVSLYDLPDELLSQSKYGLHKRLLNSKSEIIDDLSQEDSPDNKDILTIRLVVNKDLEPKWYIINERDKPDFVEMKTSDRAKLNVFYISDFLDRHFSWSKGNPLYLLLKKAGATENNDDVIIDAFRNAKKQIDNSSFDHLNEVLNQVKENAKSYGIDITDVNTTIDFKDISINEGKVCLHDEKIPYRLKGKGSKRLLSMAIQTELAKSGGIILIDEIEQGLEPDRVRFLAKILKEQNKGQVFITTHSSNVIVELDAINLFLMRNSAPCLFKFEEEFQGCLRSNPEAFFSKRILIGEGATEVGICRALDRHRISNGLINFPILGISIVDGKGKNFVNYCKKFKIAGYDVCVLCDSDEKDTNKQKAGLRELGVVIVDCQEDKSIEYQLFSELPWEAVQFLIDKATELKGEESIQTLVSNQYGSPLDKNWLNNDSPEIRDAISKASTLKTKKEDKPTEDKSWFKTIQNGQTLGIVWFNNLSEIPDSHLAKQYSDLTKWIDNV